MSDVTRILSRIEHGDPQAADQLLPLIYDELRSLAAAKLAHERPGQTLQATALVHEAYLRLVQQPGIRNQESGVSDEQVRNRNLTPDSCPLTPAFDSRRHFFAAAAEAMRRILIEAARRKNQTGRGGHMQRVPLDDVDPAADGSSPDLLSLDEAIARLEAHDALAANLVKLRYFAGLTMPEAAEALSIPLRTAERNWTYARTWLRRELA